MRTADAIMRAIATSHGCVHTSFVNRFLARVYWRIPVSALITFRKIFCTRNRVAKTTVVLQVQVQVGTIKDDSDEIVVSYKTEVTSSTEPDRTEHDGN